MNLRADIKLKRGQEPSRFELDVRFELATKGITALYGKSGAGKTSILRCIAGLERRGSCTISYGDSTWETPDNKVLVAPEQRELSYIFQENRLFPHLKIRDNLRYAFQRRFAAHGPSVDDAIAWFGLATLLTQYPEQLSGGEARRVALARAALSAPQLMLLDEPLTGVDEASKTDLLLAIRHLQQQLACPMLYISHHIDEVSQIADHLMLLEAGKIVSHGPLIELCSRIDASLAHEQDAAAILQCRVVRRDADFALTELSCGAEQRLFLSDTQLQTNQLVRIRIPARDVSIALSKPTDSSILNILQTQIDVLEDTHSSKVLLRLKIGEQFLLARITRKSVQQLGLRAGMSVYAQIKSVALLNQALVSCHGYPKQ
ncbi:MAG: molybdenum ABC transporter ATP-binding protein [Pseudomonadales bacterium]